MCGILGSVDFRFNDVVLDSLSHRGPDSAGLQSFNVGSHRVTLGHRRLSIVDLSPAGSQPMLTPCGQYAIAYNGEIYNHQQIRQQLNGTKFRGHSDTETLLQAFAQRGLAVLPECNGIFAFSLLDTERRKLYLVRDPFGVKPLYYSQKDCAVVFASEIRPILKLIPCDLDLENLAELLRLRYSPSPDTLLRDIKKVRPGHVIEIDLSGAGLKMLEYPFVGPPQAHTSLSYEDAEGHYGTLFAQAVERQLMADVEVGILLSGGIDSALVAAYARKRTPYRMRAFTVGFAGHEQVDEVTDARETASALGLEHHVSRISFEDFLDATRTCVGIVEEPLATTSIVPMHYLSDLAARHVKVVLSGQGADESLGGYGRYQGELIAGLVPAAVARCMRPVADALGIRNEQMLRGLRSLSVADQFDRYLHSYSVFDGNEIFRLIGQREWKSTERIRYFFELLECAHRKASVECMMSIDLRMNLSDDLLLYTDKVTMHHSLECRVPMLDHELVAFVESLPYQYRVRLGRSKIIHKKFARKVLSESIINRKKKGFLSPTEHWFRKGTQVREILLDSTSRFASFFDLNAVQKILAEHERGFNRERHIFLLLSLHFWMAEFA